MKTVSYNLLSKEQKQRFFLFLASTNDNSSAWENMWDDDWEYKPNMLPNMLDKTDKFSSDNGDFHIIYDNDNIVACGGIYRSPFNRHIAIAGVRTWVNPAYRNKALLKEYLLPIHRQWAVDRSCKQIALTFNDYNKNIISIFKRRRLGERDRGSRSSKHLFHTGFHEVEQPITLQYTKQWVVYERLEHSWEFNWLMLAHMS